MKGFSLRRNVTHVLFWSIISAAFIGPGTVTTASKAGAQFGLSLSWALLFSIMATIFLQEAVARISLISEKNIGQIIRLKYGAKSHAISVILFISIAFGCAAYQAGNILGAISGLALFTSISKNIWIGLIAIVCIALLWKGSFRWIANILGLVVALMGVIFIYVAFHSKISATELIQASLSFHAPAGSSLLIIGLIGTTIVPYNLFLGSGLSKGQKLSDMRIGLSIAVLIGGIISLAIMVVGTQVTGEFSFSALAQALSEKTGKWMLGFFGLGLFAAGLSSSITAPFAAAVTGQALFQNNQERWDSTSTRFRWVWLTVLFIGLVFGLADVKPIPAIILAQAINGVLLPIVAIWILIFTNDKNLLADYSNRWWQNLILFSIVGFCIFLGLFNLQTALVNTFALKTEILDPSWLILITGAILMLIILQIRRNNNKEKSLVK